MQTRLHSRTLLLGCVLGVCAVGAILVVHVSAADDTQATTDTDTLAVDEQLQQEINDFNRQIEEKQKHIDELTDQKTVYEDSIKSKQQEAATLDGQISILDSQIKKSELDIDITQNEIDSLELEITDVNDRITEKEADIVRQKGQLGDLLRELYERGNPSLVSLALLYDSFSDFYTQLEYLGQAQQGIEDHLTDLQRLKDDLTKVSDQLRKKQRAFEVTKERLKSQKEDTEGQRVYKDELLNETQDSEQKFQDLLESVKQEQQSANSEIASLEFNIRQRYANGDLDITLSDPGTLSWPVSPALGISATFHDPTYIFRRYFEHSGVDIRTPQGSPVYAAADGIVTRAKDAGLGYSYILITHSDELSTLYGHVSKLLVEDDQYVVRGQQIGLSGGLPGTSGAGTFSTGAHLHFEVRKSGIPVDPLEYLP